jgi:endoglucanase Acf2
MSYINDESTSLTRPQQNHQPQQQYHYLYGSTDTGTTSSLCLSVATDQDSLVGESLVPTDLDEAPNDTDSQHLLIVTTNGYNANKNGNGATNGPITGTTRRRKQPWWLRKASWSRRARIWTSNIQNVHPALRVVALCAAIVVFVGVTSLVLFPNAWLVDLLPQQQQRWFAVPFPKVDRGDYGDPVANFIDLSLFDPALLNKRASGRVFRFPFPTGAFWTNLVLPPTADRGLSYPCVVYPYAYKWSETLLQLGYPAEHRSEEEKAIHDYFFPDLTLTTREGTSARYITSFDALSVTLKYNIQGGGQWTTFLVQGSPYATMLYDNASPVIKAFSIFKEVSCPRDVLQTGQEIGLDKSNMGGADSRVGDSHRKLGGSDTFGVCSWSDDQNGSKRTLRGVQFIFQTLEGLTWIAFSSEPIVLEYDMQSKTTISSRDRYKGAFRLALVPSSHNLTPDSAGNQVNASVSSGLQRLIYHAGVYPISGGVSWSFRSSDEVSGLANSDKARVRTSVMPAFLKMPRLSMPSSSSTSSGAINSENPGRIGTINFQFTTQSFAAANQAANAKPLLMLALPHHANRLPSNVQLGRDQFSLVYRCIKGTMRPVLGNLWSYDETLPTLGFEVEGSITTRRREFLNPKVKQEIVRSLQEDVNLALPTLTENVYGFGKQVARLAQIAHITHMLHAANDTTTNNDDVEQAFVSTSDELDDLFQQAIDSLRSRLENFLDGSVSDYLLYDTNLGGLVSVDGLRDYGADFGNGRYNDHHFHYGYLLYACAILGNIDRRFLRQYGPYVDAIAADVSHDSNFNSRQTGSIFFPGARHKVWFDGHSFASGLFPFGNGKSQESSSEAINAYYGAYLWSLVRHNSVYDPIIDTSTETDFARLLLATEIRAAKMYWHMIPPSSTNDLSNRTAESTSVYSAQFSKNFMVGNLGMLDAISSTWFGTSALYVNMINEMPVTSITEEVFDKYYTNEEYAKVLKPLGDVEMAWRGYVVCNHAVIDPQAAWDEAVLLETRELDSGISKSQILYFIATRPDFSAAKLSIDATSATSDSALASSDALKAGSNAACSANKNCRHQKLTGFCCPTLDGTLLGCCDECMGEKFSRS